MINGFLSALGEPEFFKEGDIGQLKEMTEELANK